MSRTDRIIIKRAKPCSCGGIQDHIVIESKKYKGVISEVFDCIHCGFHKQTRISGAELVSLNSNKYNEVLKELRGE